MFYDRGGRHYYFSKYLIEKGYSPTVFCASTVHNSSKDTEIKDCKYKQDVVDGIPFVFVKTPQYKGNGLARIKNILMYSWRIRRVAKKIAISSKPDVILASSPHPFACYAAIRTAKKLGTPCIVEIRDPWPESIVAYGVSSKNNIIIRLLYYLEKWIYKKADSLIFTMEGGADYIREKGWDNVIDLNKIHYINNGVDLIDFDSNVKNTRYVDPDITDKTVFKVVYTGSIRLVNDMKTIVDAAAIVQKKTEAKIRFLFYGNGDQVESLQEYVVDNAIKNVVFKGKVDKISIPGILADANICLMHANQTSIIRFGYSLNKLFEYFAAGKPILSTLVCNFDLIGKYCCGLVVENQLPETIANAVLQMASLQEDEYDRYCENARRAASDYDFCVLTKRLTVIIEDLTRSK